MYVATPEEIAALELLVVEMELASAVSIVDADASVVTRDRDRHVGLPERTVVRDRALVLDDAPRPGPGEPGRLGVACCPWRQADLEVGARQELAGR